MAEDKRNIYQKVNAVKKGLRMSPLQKSGKNTFSKYEYMELTDFEDTLEDLCDKEGINTLFRWFPDKVILTITNMDNPSEIIEVPAPLVECGIKGATAVQNLGGTMTYLRRYLFVSTFGISEHDAVEEQAPQNKVAKQWQNPQAAIPVNQPAPPQTQPQTAPDGKAAYFELIKFFGYDMNNRESAESKKALEKKDNWMNLHFGEQVLPMNFTPDHVKKIRDFISSGPENFKSDPIV